MAIFKRKVRGKRLKTYTAKFVFGGRTHERHSFPDRETAQHWIDATRLSLRRGEVGYVKVRTAAQVMPLIEQFADHLRSLKRDDMYCYIVEQRLRRLAGDAGWLTIANITSASFDNWRSSKPLWRGKQIKSRTLNQYLEHAVEFAEWLSRRLLLLPSNPLSSLSRMTSPPNIAYRRAGTVAEIQSLLSTSPPERALLYRFLIYVPLRREALRRIVWRDFQLDAKRPTFTLRPEISKNRRPALLAIRRDLAAALRKHRGGAADDERVFDAIPAVDTLRKDLERAGVAFDDGKGQRRLDLHAFRKTAIRMLKNAGVSLDDAHVFLQHRDRRTTERHYDDDMVSPEISIAAERMPALRVVAKSAARHPRHTRGAKR